LESSPDIKGRRLSGVPWTALSMQGVQPAAHRLDRLVALPRAIALAFEQRNSATLPRACY